MKKETVKNGLKIALVAGGVFALVPTVYGQAIGIQTLDRMTTGTPQQLERGEQVYEDQCATCHGDEGRGGADLGERLGAEGFVGVEVERSGLKSIFSVITHGYEYNDEEHPVFDNLFYQDRWAVSHYVHDLIDDPSPDPEEVVARIRHEAVEGVCDPAIRDEIAGLAEPEDEAQLERGAQEYEMRCATCHGDEGRGDGPGGATVPPARDFHDPADEWTNGTSPLAIFTTLEEGIEGTAMTPFGHLPEEDLWAMTHFVREEFIPEEELEELTEEQIEDVCRALSQPPRPDPIPIEDAMQFLADDVEEERFLRFHDYGDPIVHVDADPIRGQEVYDQSCAGCHGADGSADAPLGPYGTFPPYLHIEPAPLVPASVGGTYEDVAQRTIVGPHAPLPNRPSVAAFSEQDWMDVQAYITQFEGDGRDRIRVSDEVDEIDEPEEAESFDGLTISVPLDDSQREQVQQIIEEIDDPELARQSLEETDFLEPGDIEIDDAEDAPEEEAPEEEAPEEEAPEEEAQEEEAPEEEAPEEEAPEEEAPEEEAPEEEAPEEELEQD